MFLPAFCGINGICKIAFFCSNLLALQAPRLKTVTVLNNSKHKYGIFKA